MAPFRAPKNTQWLTFSRHSTFPTKLFMTFVFFLSPTIHNSMVTFRWYLLQSRLQLTDRETPQGTGLTQHKDQTPFQPNPNLGPLSGKVSILSGRKGRT